MTTDASKIWRETASLTSSEARTPAPGGEAVDRLAVQKLMHPVSHYLQGKGVSQRIAEEASERATDAMYRHLAASPVVPVGREDIARIIDPSTFDLIAHYTGIDRLDGLSPSEREPDVFKGYPQLKELRALALAKADAILAALRPTETGWRDIATAPRDGTDVLVCDDETGERHVSYWTGDCWSGRNRFKPTHWMPLPTAPTDTWREA